MLFNSVPWCFNRIVYDQGSHDAKIKIARLVPKSSTLDHSTTLPDVLNTGLKHCKSRGATTLPTAWENLVRSLKYGPNAVRFNHGTPVVTQILFHTVR